MTTLRLPPNTKFITRDMINPVRKTITHIDIPDTVDCIEREAFSGCTSLRSANISDNVHISPNAFSNCPALIVVHASQNNHRMRRLVLQHPFMGVDELGELVALGGTIHIPETLAEAPAHDPEPPYQNTPTPLPAIAPTEPFGGDYPILTHINLSNYTIQSPPPVPPATTPFEYFLNKIFPNCPNIRLIASNPTDHPNAVAADALTTWAESKELSFHYSHFAIANLYLLAHDQGFQLSWSQLGQACPDVTFGDMLDILPDNKYETTLPRMAHWQPSQNPQPRYAGLDQLNLFNVPGTDTSALDFNSCKPVLRALTLWQAGSLLYSKTLRSPNIQAEDTPSTNALPTP